MIKRLKKDTKYLSIFILLFLMTCFLSSCRSDVYLDKPIALGCKDNIYYIINQDTTEFSLEEYDDVKNIYGDYLMVSKKGKWGYIKNTGEVATKIKYDEVYPMSENKAVVKLDNKTSIINNKGEVIYEFQDGITSVSSFKNNYLIIEKDGLFGYLKCNSDNKFEITITPAFSSASSFSEGYAAVGKIINDNLKYSYINEEGKLMTNDFIFNSADDFSNSFGKVSTKSATDLIKYHYIKFENNTLTYLQSNNEMISVDYASSFSNGIAFIANYERYEQDKTQVYKWFEIIDTSGNKNYTYAIDGYAKKKPQDFFPHNPIMLNGCLVFENSDRNRSIWELLYDSTFYYTDTTDTYHQFARSVWNISSDDKVIKDSVNASIYTEQILIKNLQTPIELGKMVFNSYLNNYTCMAKTNENKCGMLMIASTAQTITISNCADDFQITVSYFIPTIYDEILY